MKVLVTGGCGFIGSALVRHLVRNGHYVLNLDKLTYAGDERTVAEVSASPLYVFARVDIVDGEALRAAFAEFAPDIVYHLAAESHVDRSIDGPSAFIETNITGTYQMLEAARAHWLSLNAAERNLFRFVHVSTDEVYGSLGPEGLFTEATAYAPNSPYSASKAAADHLVRAWFKTYGLPVLISNCSNNYGLFQNREKLIPTVIRKALAGQPVPIYGTGVNVRDWLYVEDHVEALTTIAARGRPGEKYNIGGHNEIRNIDIAELICARLDTLRPRQSGTYRDLITFVSDRPGHDFRYSIDPSKSDSELCWRPKETFESGIKKTIDWYLEHTDWIFADENESDRLGLGAKGAMP